MECSIPNLEEHRKDFGFSSSFHRLHMCYRILDVHLLQFQMEFNSLPFMVSVQFL